MKNLSKYFCLLSVGLILFAGLSLVLGHPGFGSGIFTLSYLALSVTSLLYIFEIWIKNEK